ncbi:MAG: hypothetical protein DRI71_04790 [Bacteroidetes bacterium]|nr:MAG: hypothetical protein DRI71_04790 [Bacteroidota bacterium]
MTAVQTYSYPIRPYHTGVNGRLFIYQLLNFLQDAAHKHADGYGFGQLQLENDNLFWVLSRLSIEIKALPKVGDEINLSTWVKSIRGAISEREFTIILGENTIINASSLWFCLSGESHKPTRLPSTYIDLMIINNVYSFQGGSVKVSESENIDQKSSGLETKAAYSDIDMVDHVNNATYIRWMMDELSQEFHLNKQLKQLDVNYLGECFLGDIVKVNHHSQSGPTLQHEVANEVSGKVICRANSLWQ